MPQRLKPGGVGEYFTPEGIIEEDTSTCNHCQNITKIPSRRRMMEVVEFCRTCGKLICLECAGKSCKTWEEQMEKFEARYLMLKDMGLV